LAATQLVRAKFYELTAAGRKRLREELDGWNRLTAAMGFVLTARPDRA
jgi:PadR family transcriptional regulator, regulatory protein PadR